MIHELFEENKYCFIPCIFIYPGAYPQPFMVLSSCTKIYAVDILTEDRLVKVIEDSRNDSFAISSCHDDIEIDVNESKIYFIYQKDVKRINFDFTDLETFAKNASAHDMTVDWIGRRIFFVQSNNLIHQIAFNDKKKSIMKLTPGTKFYEITTDPLKG